MTIKTFFNNQMMSMLLRLPRIESGVIFGSALIASLCYQGFYFDSLQEIVQYISALLLFTAITLTIFAGFGLYQYSLLKASVERMPKLTLAMTTVALATTIVAYFVPRIDLGRLEWLTVFAVTFTALAILRKGISRALSQHSPKKKVLILGAGRKALQLDQAIGSGTDRIEIVGFVHQPGEREFVDTNKVIYSVNSLEEFANEHGVDEIVVAVDERRNCFPLKSLLACRLHGTSVTDLLGFYETECGQIKLDFLEHGWLVFSEGFRTNTNYAKIKRCIDYCYSATYLFLTYPMFMLINLLWQLSSHRATSLLIPITAIGQRGASFDTLAYAPEVEGTAFATLIAMLKLSNFPMMRAVYRSQMSLVGPALDSDEQSQVPLAEVAYYEERYLLKPGVYSWDKVSNPNAHAASRTERLQYDLYYVKNKSIYLDLIILMQGVRTHATTGLAPQDAPMPMKPAISAEK